MAEAQLFAQRSFVGELFDHQNRGLVFQRTDAVGFIGRQVHHLQAVGFEAFFFGGDSGAAIEHNQQHNGIGLIGRDFVVFLQGELHDLLVVVFSDNAAQERFGVERVLLHSVIPFYWFEY